jgi:hypothetical protein
VLKLLFSCLAIGSIVCTATSQSAGNAQNAIDAEARISKLEKQILEITFSGGSTAFARQLTELTAELKQLKESIKTKPNFERTNYGWFSGFFQNQFTYTDSQSGPNDAFRSRRQRLNYNHIGDSRTMGRISVDFASGINQTTAQIRDAFIQYRPNTYLESSGPTYTIGGQNFPIGYEIAYPSWARTWPERAAYNQAYFNGERGRGALYQNGSNSNYWYAGVFNSLSVNDVEQVSVAPGQDSEIGPLAGFHASKGSWDYGVSGFTTNRPEFGTSASSSPNSDRYFTYIEGRFHPKHSPWDVRFEVMNGKDRLPNATANPFSQSTPTRGFHVNFDHKISKQNTLVIRTEQHDRDTSANGDTLTQYGIGYIRDVNQFLRLSLTTEWIHDGLRSSRGQTDFNLITIRAQFRF